MDRFVWLLLIRKNAHVMWRKKEEEDEMIDAFHQSMTTQCVSFFKKIQWE